ncbi:Pyrimidine-specific ribonucleoside hydrolase RihB [Falsiruegeria litorea R37]|uniref:Pyrimidine-specific ribonucleoside hydrolase RihB n=1 Tax=Falsiruegeria litorea R37 TaxID=1200284 RepID=A0A1Y5SD33_9RHOB|nr:nucleoside hydrolase [Falsiruegeria litorea]SLN35191.1 Pyrimidine-specific ribonucleoside hydrolase RihB [Falsiruegeria litorea R37]
MKLIIDTDPGIDDAMAIAYAHAAPDIDLLGLTTVFGNTHVAQSSRNARYLLNLLWAELPVATGAALPYGAGTYQPSAYVHGDEGFGHFTDVPQIGVDHHLSAAEYLVEMARAHRGALSVCAIGPLTNIADAIRLDPAFLGNLAQLVIMGGAVFCPGNITAHAEANIYHDAQAAAEVLGAEGNVVLVGLDVTLQTLYRAQDFEELARASKTTGGFLQEISRFYLEFYQSVAGEDGCGLHDSTAVIACTHPHLFEMVETGVQVDVAGEAVGATRAVESGPKIRVCRDIDGDAVVDLFTRQVASLP